jgi:hypothetical protein
MKFEFSKSPRELGAMVVAVIVAGAMAAPAVAQVGIHHGPGGPGGGVHSHLAGAGGSLHHGMHGGGPGGWHGGGGGGHWQGGQWVVPGLALGILGAAAAAATYGPPPAPGMCWDYNDPSQTSGFWDYCH